jgi:hypothetical protein
VSGSESGSEQVFSFVSDDNAISSSLELESSDDDDDEEEDILCSSSVPVAASDVLVVLVDCC